MCTPVRFPRRKNDRQTDGRPSGGCHLTVPVSSSGPLFLTWRVGAGARAWGLSPNSRARTERGACTLPTTAQAFRLEFNSPWNKGAETEQTWSVKFHTTGTGMSSQSEAETHALAFAAF